MDTHEDTDKLHPDELLAGYVDGSAPPDERRAVERHVAACERCRSETELAASARAALVSLPELEAPGLADAGLDAFRREPAEEFAAGRSTGRESLLSRIRARPSRIHWDRVALGAGLAAAAGLFVIFIAVGLTRSGQRASNGPALAASPVSGLPRVIDRGATYSPITLQALSSQLRAPAAQGKTLNLAPTGPPLDRFAPASGEQANAPSPATNVSGPASVLACLRTGTGLLSSAQPIYLEAADFQGTPAYVGAFVLPPAASGSSPHLIVVAVSRTGCQPLYEVRQSL
jgi:hypothetical protein